MQSLQDRPFWAAPRLFLIAPTTSSMDDVRPRHRGRVGELSKKTSGNSRVFSVNMLDSGSRRSISSRPQDPKARRYPQTT